MPDLALRPLGYHGAVVDYLREREKALWDWYASADATNDQIAAVRLELLKTTIRVERESAPRLYAAAEKVMPRLGLSAPVTFYQAITWSTPNASLVTVPGEAHLVLEGDVAGGLDESELEAVIAHELGHLRLWQEDAGAFLVAMRMLSALAYDSRSEPAVMVSRTLLHRFDEVYADRASLVATGNLEATVAALVKLQTGLRAVNAAAYIRQADEIFETDQPTTAGLTHPETFIRVRALAQWSRLGDAADDEIHAMITGRLRMDELDLVRQAELEQLTRDLIQEVLAPVWMRTEAALAHARLFFVDFTHSAPGKPAQLAMRLADVDSSVRDYVAYVLLDFAAADPELDDMALAHSLELADELGLRARLEELAAKELKTSKRTLAGLRGRGKAMLAEISAREGKSAAKEATS